MPRFTIVVPAYNAAETIAETLDAILAQSYADWECVVVDDGSTDETLRLVQSYANRDDRIRVLSQENQGSAGAYNTGVSAAEGDHIVMCSADDVLLPDHLAEMDAFIDAEPGYDIYSTNGYLWGPDDARRLVYAEGVRDEVLSLALADVIRLCFYSVGAVYRRSLFGEVGGYRIDVFGEDYDFWLRAMAGGARHRYLPKALSLHRVSPTQKSARLQTAYESDMRLVRDLRDKGGLSPAELSAVDDNIRERTRLIAELHTPPPRRRLRTLRVKVATRLLGEARYDRLKRAVKQRLSHGPGAR